MPLFTGVDIKVRPGYSGSPVVDSFGRSVSVMTAKPSSRDRAAKKEGVAGYAVPPRDLAMFIDKIGLR